MDVVPHLLAAVAVDGVVLACHGAAHQVREEPVQPRAGMVRAGEAPAAKADGRHVEVAAVLLDDEIGRSLRGSEERMEAVVDRHRDRDAARSTRALGELEPRLELLERKEVRTVAVDLVRRREDERRLGLVQPRRLEQVDRPGGVDREVRQRLRCSPVVRGLGGGVDDELEARRVLCEQPARRRRSRGCRSERPERVGYVASSCSVCGDVDAVGPKKYARMSFSRPITS